MGRLLGWFCFFFSSRRRHTRWTGDWSSDVCSSDLYPFLAVTAEKRIPPMAVMPSPLPQAPPKDVRCAGRVEVDAEDQIIPALTVKTWVAHLRIHVCTEQEIGLVWLLRARQGVTR